MSNRTISLDDELYEYLCSVSLREDPLLRKLREKTASMPERSMQIAPEQGQFMALLVKLLNARACLEIGVFTGYSSLCVAKALPENGKLIACDLSEEWTSIAKEFWCEAKLSHKVELRLGPALKTLDALIDEGKESFDFVFIDADKTGYRDYYERALALTRSGGLITFDNVLRGGAVIDEDDDSAETAAIRQLNEILLSDDRVDISLVPIGDGLTLARKR